MSIAVRVSVWILGVLVVVSAAVAVLALMQKQSLQGQNQTLHNQVNSAQGQLSDLNSQIKKITDDETELNNKISQAQQEKNQLQTQYDALKQKNDDFQNQLTQANSDRDDWKNRVDTITHERDELADKLKNQPAKIVYRDRVVQAAAPVEGAEASAPVVNINVPSGQNDQYWASVLKQKAALQIAVDREKSDLDSQALQIVELKKQNSDLELQVKQVSNEKDEIVQKIKYGQDLADNLSIDLARSRNDQEAVNDRADKLKEENLELLAQLRSVSSTKVELEQTISRLTDDKDAMQKKLIETESVIQNRIDDIWKIKEGLDKKLSENSAVATTSTMELPPIIVNAPAGQQQPMASSPAAPTAMSGKTEGAIISINESNNFVIVDLGQQNSAVNIGTPFKVYRNNQVIGNLEVIQVRRDISAADIKDKTADLKVGDVVRFN